MGQRMNRRRFLQTGAATTTAVIFVGGQSIRAEKKAAEKLRIGIIGCGGMGGGNHSGMLSETIVAVCDVDKDRLQKEGAKKSPKAKLFTDWRKLLDECGKELDAVVVSTPDHTHAIASVTAMRLGLHCYTEKPLTHDVFEARLMQKTAAGTKAKGGGPLMTQMGNRGTAQDGFRRGVELLQAGVLGKATEVHVWTNRPIWPQGMTKRPTPKEVPANLVWDLWLGTAPERPYADGYHPFKWRGYWDFGTGALGDMACHTANLPFMGLKLGAPTSVSAEFSPVSQEAAPNWCTIVYEFPARGDLPPVRLTWYDGTKDGKRNQPPAEVTKGVKLKDSGSIIVGSKGMMFSPDDYGGAQQWIAAEGEKIAGLDKVPKTLPRAPGQNHYRDWIEACKSGKASMSNFAYAGPLTEFVLLGNVAVRVGKKVEWDSEKLASPNCPEAAQYVKRQYRKGWSLEA